MRNVFAAIVLMTAVGCGGNNSSNSYGAQVNGSVGGVPLTNLSATFDQLNPLLQLDAIEIGGIPQTCAYGMPLPTCQEPSLDITLFFAGAQSYTIGQGQGQARYLLPGGNASQGQSGTVVIETATGGGAIPSEVTGTFDITFDTGDHVTGHFDACRGFAACAEQQTS